MSDSPSIRDQSNWPPGTLLLSEVHHGSREIVLQPRPTTDPNDPLNWSRAYKAFHYTVVCSYVLLTFVQLDIGFTAWGPMIDELGFSVEMLNSSAAINWGGLAVGCIFFVPLVHKYGRRSVYIFSTALQLAACVWQAEVYTTADLLLSSFFSGLGGAISETIVQMTIADVFFTHQHATMNAIYVAATFIGATVGPIVSGYIVEGQGWRWMWWWCVVFLAIQLVAVIFGYEDSKYAPLLPTVDDNDDDDSDTPQSSSAALPAEKSSVLMNEKTETINSTRHSHTTEHEIHPIPTRKTYWQRLRLFTTTPDSVVHHLYQPIIILFTFPAVTFTAVTFGTLLLWFATVTSTQAVYLLEPPYNFSPAAIGLINIALLVGSLLAFLYGGSLNDKSILWLSKRNHGVYEPEMRLWLTLPNILFTPAGLLIFGIGLAHQLPWIVLAVGCAIFSFGMVASLELTLSYCIDAYQDIIGDALVGIVFMRNALAMITLFVLTPWTEGVGIQNLYVTCACVSFVVALLPVVFLIWGRKARELTAARYKRMALMLSTQRMFRAAA